MLRVLRGFTWTTALCIFTLFFQGVWELALFLSPSFAARFIDSVDDAIAHINRHGSGHSEAIVTRSLEHAQAFQQGVDSACVYVNASTRFTDGGESRKVLDGMADGSVDVVGRRCLVRWRVTR